MITAINEIRSILDIQRFVSNRLPYFDHMRSIFTSHNEIYATFLETRTDQHMEFSDFIRFQLECLENDRETTFRLLEEAHQRRIQLVEGFPNNEIALLNLEVQRSRELITVSGIFALLVQNLTMAGRTAFENPVDQYNRILEEEIDSFIRAANINYPDLTIDDILNEFLSTIQARARLRMFTLSSLILVFTNEQIRDNCRFEYKHVVEMAMRIGLKEKYSYTTTDIDGNRTATYDVNMDPVWQMYILLCRYAHANTLSTLSQSIGVSQKHISIIERGVEKQIYLLQGDALNPSRCSLSIDYLEFLKDTSPNPSDPQYGTIRHNTCLFVDGSFMPISRPTDAAPGHDKHYSGKDKIHCFRHQVMCDSNGLIMSYFGPAEGSIHDKRLLDMSGLIEELPFFKVGDDYLQCFGDAGYIGVTSPTDQFCCSKKGTATQPLTREDQLYNEQHAKIRIVVEQCFSNISNFWKGTKSRFRNRLYVSDLSMRMTVAFFITNCHMICYRGCTNQKLFEYDDSSGTFISNDVIDLELYINQWIHPEFYRENHNTLLEKLMEDTSATIHVTEDDDNLEEEAE